MNPSVSAPPPINPLVPRIEAIVAGILLDLVSGSASGALSMVRRSAANATENDATGALALGGQVTTRRLRGAQALPFARVMAVLGAAHGLLIAGTSVSQRELYYMLVAYFRNQAQLNKAVQDACATLGVPRCALGIGAATRGVVGGCVRIAPADSVGVVNGEAVGSTGWPIPGDLTLVDGVQFQSSAHCIVVIEKMGIFQRLYEDRFFERLPCILLCGRGYPSVATRLMLARLASVLHIPVYGIADYNPHGCALLQTYRRGGVRTALEASEISTDIKWLGLRASHLQAMPWVTLPGEELTTRDKALVKSLKKQAFIAQDRRYLEELDLMEELGKHELQTLYGHPEGTRYLSSTFLPNALLQHDYI